MCGCIATVLPPKLELIIATCSSIPLRSAKHGHSDFVFIGPAHIEPFPHTDTEYLSQNLVKITYCSAQQNDFLKLNILGHFIFSSTYQKQLSSNYGTQSSPVSILDTHASVFLSSKTSYRIKSLASVFSLPVKTSPASFLKSSARKSVP